MRCGRSAASPVAFALALALSWPSEAHALDLEGGLKLGVATKPRFASSTTPYGVGFGARAGINLFHIYIGVAGIAYFGGSFEAPSQAAGHVKIGWSSTFVGGEIGTTVQPSKHLILRPQLGVGGASFSVTIDGTPLESANTGYQFPDHSNHVYFEPNLTVMVPIEQFYVGVDGGSLIVEMGHPYPTFAGHIQAGVFF